MAGLLQARLPELDLEGVPDPRAREGRWKLSQILGATLLGLMAGCRACARPSSSRRGWRQRCAGDSDEGRAIRWRALLAWVRDALVAATEDQLAGLRELAAATR